MARGKHRAAAQQRYDQHADQQIATLREQLIEANRARRDAEERAAQADALQVALQRATTERDATSGPEVRRLNARVAELQEKVREADKTQELRWDQLLALKEKVWALLPGKNEEKLEWLWDVLPGQNQWSGVAGRTVHDPRLVVRKGRTDPTYQYLMQRAQGRRTTLERPMHTIEARMVDARDRAKWAETDFPQTTEDINWLSDELYATRQFLRDIRDLLLVGAVGEATTRIMDVLAKTPPAQTHIITDRRPAANHRTLDGRVVES